MAPEHDLHLQLNGVERTATVPGGAVLVDALRESFAATGTNVGCRTGDCGACTVLIDGQSAKSCVVLAGTADGHSVTTIEGMRSHNEMRVVQQAFVENFGFQCGYCLPGMLLTTYELLSRTLDPTPAERRQAINGNLCRCTGYESILTSMEAAADGIAALRAGAGLDHEGSGAA